MAVPNRVQPASLRRPNPFGRSSGGGGKGHQSLIGWVLIVVAIGIGAAAFWFHGSAQSTLVELRSDNLCPKDAERKPPAVYVILIDQTDPIQPLGQQSILNTVLTSVRAALEGPESDEAARNALVEVWTFSNDGKNVTVVGEVRVATQQVLSVCNPGAAGEWDKLYRNVEVVRRQHSRFYSSLEDTLRSSLNFPEAKQSPVVEAIYAIGVQVFSRPNAVGAKKHLLLVSDLLQNTQNLSMFSGRPRFDKWISTSQAQKALPSLPDVKVKAFVIPGTRPELQDTEFATF